MHLVFGKITELIDLVGDAKRGRQILQNRMIRILDADGDFLIPRMAIKICADQLAVFLPVVQRVGGRVDAAEALPVAHESQHVRLLLIA